MIVDDADRCCGNCRSWRRDLSSLVWGQCHVANHYNGRMIVVYAESDETTKMLPMIQLRTHQQHCCLLHETPEEYGPYDTGG